MFRAPDIGYNRKVFFLCRQDSSSSVAKSVTGGGGDGRRAGWAAWLPLDGVNSKSDVQGDEAPRLMADEDVR